MKHKKALQTVNTAQLFRQLINEDPDARRGLRDLEPLESGLEGLIEQLRQLYRENRIDECVEIFQIILDTSQHKLAKLARTKNKR